MKFRPLVFASAMTLFAALTTALELAAQEQNQQPPRYIVTDLGTLGGTFGSANAVNNRGSVVGFATLPGDTEGHAFLWNKGMKSNLGTLGGLNSSAFFLNEGARSLVTLKLPLQTRWGKIFAPPVLTLYVCRSFGKTA